MSKKKKTSNTKKCRSDKYVSLEEFRNMDMSTQDAKAVVSGNEMVRQKNTVCLSGVDKLAQIESEKQQPVCENSGLEANGEEPLSKLLLDPSHNFRVPGKALKSGSTLHCAMDIGSTHQRTKIFTTDLEYQSDVICLDTAYSVIKDENTDMNCVSNSKSIADNLEMIITCENPHNDTMIPEIHIVKGSLMDKMNGAPKNLTSDTSKVDSQSTYVNIICNAAIATLLHRLNNKEDLSAQSVIDLVVSIPPDDANLKSRIETFKNRLDGIYKVNFVRLGVTIEVSIQSPRIRVYSEPLAAALYTIMNDDFDMESTCIFMDCGGRSSGVIAFSNGKLKEASSYAFPIGGSHLINSLSDKIANEFKIQRPRNEVLLKAINTGVYKFGSSRKDIIKCINTAKTEISEALYSGLAQGISYNQLQASEIETVYCSGRSFGQTKGESGTSPTMCTNLQELYKEKCPDTVFMHVADEFAIVRGLVFARLRSGDQ